MSGRFWPVAEAAQADYEALRAAVLCGRSAGCDLAAARFARRGLAGVIAWPAAEPFWRCELVGSARPDWCGREDPREAALAAAYGFLLAHTTSVQTQVVAL